MYSTDGALASLLSPRLVQGELRSILCDLNDGDAATDEEMKWIADLSRATGEKHAADFQTVRTAGLLVALAQVRIYQYIATS